MKLKCYSILLLIFVNVYFINGQNFYELILDSTAYKVDTIFLDTNIEITYHNFLCNSKFKVSFIKDSCYIPDGACQYFDSSDNTIFGQYKNGRMIGNWIEKDKNGYVIKRVNYDSKLKYIAKDSLLYKGKFRKDIAQMDFFIHEWIPVFNGDSTGNSFNRFIQQQTFKPPSARFFNYENKKVIVGFVVTRFGEVVNIIVLRGGESDLNREAIRLVSISPKWSLGLAEKPHSDYDFVIQIFFDD